MKIISASFLAARFRLEETCLQCSHAAWSYCNTAHTSCPHPWSIGSASCRTHCTWTISWVRLHAWVAVPLASLSVFWLNFQALCQVGPLADFAWPWQISAWSGCPSSLAGRQAPRPPGLCCLAGTYWLQTRTVGVHSSVSSSTGRQRSYCLSSDLRFRICYRGFHNVRYTRLHCSHLICALSCLDTRWSPASLSGCRRPYSSASAPYCRPGNSSKSYWGVWPCWWWSSASWTRPLIQNKILSPSSQCHTREVSCLSYQKSILLIMHDYSVE